MTFHYLDPSAWVKRHFQEDGSDAVYALFAGPLHAACCRLGLLEMIATIARKSHQESLDSSVTQSLLENVNDDFAAFRACAADEPCVVLATQLALRHRLRTMDAIHLACASILRPEGEVVMVSSDAELLEAARREGMGVLDPMIA